jgi:DNA-binding beta-propeller fold protein YncE
LLDLDGVCLKTIGKKGDGAGDFALPKGVAFDSEGHIYVVDAQFENIQVFDPNGQLLMAFGEEGNGLGEFSLPAGLMIDGMDRIWVADAGNHRIQVFSYMRTSS